MYEKLKDIFNAVAIKNLAAVDIPKQSSLSRGSNQHEIGGLAKAGFANYLGKPKNGEVTSFKATMVYIGHSEEELYHCEDKVSWYDTRYRSPNRGPEFRLYYRTNDVTALLQEGDFFLIALTKQNSLLMVFTPPGSEQENQLRVLFGAAEAQSDKTLTGVDFNAHDLLLPVQTMLKQFGIELFTERSGDEERLQQILTQFGPSFPRTRDFSAFARHLTNETVDAEQDPDHILITWLDEEEHLFRLLERHIVAQRLQLGFGEHGDDVDEFIKFSLSVQNRRKSRAGHSFENHIEEVMRQNQLSFIRGGKTEGKQTPDFLFPGQSEYHDLSFPNSRLRMLGAKTSCKERWRQVLAEANRVDRKHLITLEPAISEDQTNQMDEMGLQLVIPSIIQRSYTSTQKEYLISFAEFIREVKEL